MQRTTLEDTREGEDLITYQLINNLKEHTEQNAILKEKEKFDI